MSALGLIAQARAFGAELIPIGDTLRVRARRPLPAKLVAALRAHKPELLAVLTVPPDGAKPGEPGARRNVTTCGHCGRVHIFWLTAPRLTACPWCGAPKEGAP